MIVVLPTKVLIAFCSFALTWLLTARASGAHRSGLTLSGEAFPMITIAGLLGAIIATLYAG